MISDVKPSACAAPSRAKRVRSALALRRTISNALAKGGEAASSARVIMSKLRDREMRNRFYDGMLDEQPHRLVKEARRPRTVRKR